MVATPLERLLCKQTTRISFSINWQFVGSEWGTADNAFVLADFLTDEPHEIL